MEWSIALLFLVVLLALIGALRWDALRASLFAMFAPKQEGSPPVQELRPPKHLHGERTSPGLQPSHKPAIHRSGRRG